MAGRDIIVVGASAGGVEALQKLVAEFPPDLAAAVFVVLHLSPESRSVLPQILQRAGPLPAAHAIDGEAVAPGRIYVSPPDRHLVLVPGAVRLTRGPRENRHRPCVDVMFRAAAAAYGPRVIGVVLTGALDDGTLGLAAIKAAGGLAVVQDPAEAFQPAMPAHALENVAVDHCLPLAGMGTRLAALASAPGDGDGGVGGAGRGGVTTPPDDDPRRVGAPSEYTCPECHGTLWEVPDGEMAKLRCRVGHSYTVENLAADMDANLESALWAAMRVLEERAALARRMAASARGRNQPRSAEMNDEIASTQAQHAATIRQILDRP